MSRRKQDAAGSTVSGIVTQVRAFVTNKQKAKAYNAMVQAFERGDIPKPVWWEEVEPDMWDFGTVGGKKPNPVGFNEMTTGEYDADGEAIRQAPWNSDAGYALTLQFEGREDGELFTLDTPVRVDARNPYKGARYEIVGLALKPGATVATSRSGRADNRRQQLKDLLRQSR